MAEMWKRMQKRGDGTLRWTDYHELGGASGITMHLRLDRRHIQDRDVQLLRRTVKTKLNLEMAAAKEITCAGADIIVTGTALEQDPDVKQTIGEMICELKR